MTADWKQLNIEKAIEYSIQATKAALLINGGAAVAILALVGAVSSQNAAAVAVDINDLKLALHRFGLGTVAATSTFAFAYFAQLAWAGVNHAQAIGSTTALYRLLAEVLRFFGIAALISSVWLFYSGVTSASDAVRAVAPKPLTQSP
jgi:hypothetical protein